MPVVNTENLTIPSGPLPYQNYKVRVLDIIQKPSAGKNGKPPIAMDTWHCEIIHPDTVEVGGETVAAAGREFDLYMTFGMKNLAFVKKDLAALGITMPANVNIPTDDEISTGARTRCADIQDLTLLAKGCEFTLGLMTEETFKNTGAGGGYKPILDENGQKIPSGHVIRANFRDVASPLVDSAGNSPFDM